MSHQHPRENEFSDRITRLEEEVRRLTFREERVTQTPPTADGLSCPRNLEEEYLVQSQLRSSLQEQLRTKDEQLRTMEEQLRTNEEKLHTTEEQLRTKDEQLRTNEEQLRTKNEQMRIKDEQLQTQQRILTSTRKTPKRDGVSMNILCIFFHRRDVSVMF